MTIVLAIETSQRIGGVAVRDRAGVVHEEMLSPKKRHDDDLMPAIDRVFSRAGLSPVDLRSGAVGISIGPGGFTGLRIAVTTAKLLAETQGAKVIAVPSARVAAQSMKDQSVREIVVALASKGESAWCTRLRRTPTTWPISGERGLRDAATLDLRGIDALCADEFLPPSIRARCEVEHVPIVEPEFEPRACLVLAEEMLAQGHATDPLRLSPLYPREPEAVTIWNRRLKESKT